MLNYPKEELVNLDKNNKLMDEWNSHIANKNMIKGYTSDDFVRDGFYPFYYSQKIKLLFIGRESRGISGCNYIDILYNAYKDNRIGKRHINKMSNRIHNLMFYITYGIENNITETNKIPKASNMTKDFATENGISFAFMNLSKFSNENKHFPTDYNLVNNFIEISNCENRNFWNDQISILNPNYIITMGLSNYLNYFGEIKTSNDKKYPREYEIKINDKYIKLIDTYHFSAWTKNKNKYFYLPILEVIREQSK
jgi:hypothetical protein